MKKRTTDGWTVLTIVVTDDVADAIARLGNDRLGSLEPDDRRRMRALCKAKGWVLAEVMAGLGIAQLLRRVSQKEPT